MHSPETLDGLVHTAFAEAGMYARQHNNEIGASFADVTKGSLEVDDSLWMSVDERGIVTALHLRVTKDAKHSGEDAADMYTLSRAHGEREGGPGLFANVANFQTKLVELDPVTGAASVAKGIGPKRQQRAVGILKSMQSRLGNE